MKNIAVQFYLAFLLACAHKKECFAPAQPIFLKLVNSRRINALDFMPAKNISIVAYGSANSMVQTRKIALDSIQFGNTKLLRSVNMGWNSAENGVYDYLLLNNADTLAILFLKVDSKKQGECTHYQVNSFKVNAIEQPLVNNTYYEIAIK